jgi:hypothetical protein
MCDILSPSLTFPALARDRYFAQFCLKVMGCPKVSSERLGFCQLHADDFPARSAYEIKVWAVYASKLVPILLVNWIDAGDQPKLSQQIQCPVDGRDVYGGTQGLNLGIDLFRRGSALNLMHNGQHHLPLWCKSQAAFAEPLDKDLFTSHNHFPL